MNDGKSNHEENEQETGKQETGGQETGPEEIQRDVQKDLQREAH
ncbi:MAG: hypothetical protein ACKOAG_11200 [Candidatus Kapaibacterium sp.]